MLRPIQVPGLWKDLHGRSSRLKRGAVKTFSLFWAAGFGLVFGVELISCQTATGRFAALVGLLAVLGLGTWGFFNQWDKPDKK